MAMQRRGDLTAKFDSAAFPGAPRESFILRCFSTAQDGLSHVACFPTSTVSSVYLTPCSHAQHEDRDQCHSSDQLSLELLWGDVREGF